MPWLVGFLAMFLAGCAAVRPPVLPAVRDTQPKTPVVFIVGTTGSQLRDRDTGQIVWGATLNFFLPRDGGYRLALPLADEAAGHDTLEPADPVMELRLLGVYRIEIYTAIVRLMEQNGYRLGDLRAPRPGDDFFFYVYDWRRDNVHAAAALARQLETLRRQRRAERLTVSLISHSDGAHLARYFTKYGGASLDEAERDRVPADRPVVVDKLILVASANGGSLGMLQMLNRGRNYLPLLGRAWSPEVFFTSRRFYQHLPVHRRDLFFDEAGQQQEIDLFDVANWERFGWSVYAPAVQARLARTTRFGTAAERESFLRRQLDRGRRFAATLARDTPSFGSTRYYSLQNAFDHAPARALVTERDGRWMTVFFDEPPVTKNSYWRSLAGAPGDGYATVASQDWLSPQETAALAWPPVYVRGGHLSMVTNPAVQRYLLEALAE